MINDVIYVDLRLRGENVAGLRGGGGVRGEEVGSEVPRGSSNGEDESVARLPRTALLRSIGVMVSPSSRKYTCHWLSKAK